ncbi:membrane protein [Sphaerisporangium siamense]|uniref:Uncharacterized membrane protein YoaK (UPF0700 family) n=1 Tax=Sphaerisporangium siamense TaxID=795645 RepID=A0A7W7D573_9ACTN|nr:YoaK family protein [Sphaerisporangium siamense]MBB4699530.1 uncharacterized membrane protein YoaK (UPF0700 family) [Sphaerisporangium siamense]GII86944.1 membrane protein [Sphaerisporangium siamense]
MGTGKTARPDELRGFGWPVWGSLTAIAGMVDAVSFTALSQVFTSNMTGNLLMMGFAAGGVAQFSVVATLISLASFFAGAALGGRLTAATPDPRRRLVLGLVVETVLHVAAALAAFFVLSLATPSGRYPLIVILGLAMGMRNTVIRRLKVPDIVTTVVTGTLTNVAADSIIGTGTRVRMGRREGQIVALVVGAAVGTVILLRFGLPVALTAIAAVSVLVTLGYVARSGGPEGDGGPG